MNPADLEKIGGEGLLELINKDWDSISEKHFNSDKTLEEHIEVFKAAETRIEDSDKLLSAALKYD